jgi:phospholipid transport system transporter-binding protein
MIRCDDGRCAVDGPLTIANAAQLAEEGRRMFVAERVVVDLKGVTEVDSAGVSLLLEWRRAASGANRQIEFVHLPANLKSLAVLYGVAELLGEARTP